MSHHALVLIDRGQEHRHRFAPSCSCGWGGVPRRRKKEAVAQQHRHADSPIKYRSAPALRDLTPVADLPDSLREVLA